jgi:hypothetical protein
VSASTRRSEVARIRTARDSHQASSCVVFACRPFHRAAIAVWARVMALLAKVSENSNSALARPNLSRLTWLKIWPKSRR